MASRSGSGSLQQPPSGSAQLAGRYRFVLKVKYCPGLVHCVSGSPNPPVYDMLI